MPDEILIFGAIGTQLVIDRRIFELVALGESGAATWRTRCVVCHSPVFAEVKAGRLPARCRCNAHLNSRRHAEEPIVEYQHEAEVAEIAALRPPATISREEWIRGLRERREAAEARAILEDPGGRYIDQRAIEAGKEIVGRARDAIAGVQEMHPDAAAITGFVKMHMGDPEETTVEARVGAHPAELRVSSREVVERGDKAASAELFFQQAIEGHTGGPLVLSPSEEFEDEAEDYSPESLAVQLAEMAPEEEEIPAEPDEEDVWMRRLNMYYGGTHAMWLPSFGPRPDQPGCLAPPEYLARFRR